MANKQGLKLRCRKMRTKEMPLIKKRLANKKINNRQNKRLANKNKLALVIMKHQLKAPERIHEKQGYGYLVLSLRAKCKEELASSLTRDSKLVKILLDPSYYEPTNEKNKKIAKDIANRVLEMNQNNHEKAITYLEKMLAPFKNGSRGNFFDNSQLETLARAAKVPNRHVKDFVRNTAHITSNLLTPLIGNLMLAESKLKGKLHV